MEMTISVSTLAGKDPSKKHTGKQRGTLRKEYCEVTLEESSEVNEI
jgi:hypothetical protein